MRMSFSCFWFVLSVLVLLSNQMLEATSRDLHSNGLSREPTVISVISTSPANYVGQRASFGDPMEGERVIRANLMIPPNNEVDRTLCTFPKLLNNFSHVENIYNAEAFTLPIALFISADGCTPGQKARVALEIQKNVTRAFQYLIIYSTDQKDGNTLLELQPGDSSPVDELANLGIIYLPYEGAIALSQRLADRASTLRADPRFLQPDNGRWAFFIRIEDESDFEEPFDDSPDIRVRSSGTDPDSFYFVRFVLFTVLIVSPCFRAAYLWYAGGGRFHFRRNDHERIVGIQYIPPMPYWLSSGLRPAMHHVEAASTTLNEEQFNALPEILYQPPVSESEEGAAGSEDEIVESKIPDAYESSEVPSTELPEAHSIKLSDVANIGGEMDFTGPVVEEEKIDVEQPTSEHPLASGTDDLSTTCTMCSICIDEFEAGERLTLLPRCQHAFHRDCIMPWLMERQGCCPLCKSNVLNSTQDTDSDASIDASDENPSTPDAQN